MPCPSYRPVLPTGPPDRHSGKAGTGTKLPPYQKGMVIKMDQAIALLEVQAMVTAIVGLDAMVKAADVKLIHVEKRLGGRLVTLVVEGSVSAVQAAAEAGKAAAAEVGPVKLCEVIARPHPEVMKFLRTDPVP